MEYTQKVDAVRIVAVEYPNAVESGGFSMFSEAPEWLRKEGQDGHITFSVDPTNDYTRVYIKADETEYVGQADDWVVHYPDGYIRIWPDEAFKKNFVLFDAWR